MSQSLRNYLIKLQQDETLKEYLGSNYEIATKEEKEKFLSFVDNQIEYDVDCMLNEYVDYRINTSPEKKQNNKIKVVYTTLTVLLSGFSGYAINEEAWGFVVFIYILLVVTQSLPYIINKE